MSSPVAHETVAPVPEGDAIEGFLTAAATRGEIVVSAARGVFCLFVFLRYVLLGGLHQQGAVLEVPALCLAIGVSVALIARGRRAPLGRFALALSVVTDAVICFAALLPNILWPWPGYQGLFATPDPAALIVVAMTSGFRLYPAVTLGAGALHLVSLATLATLDLLWWSPTLSQPWRNISILTILLVSAIVLGALAGARTLRLTRSAAARAVEIERARAALTTLLQDHHDVRSFLSSATLNSDVMLRSLELSQRDVEGTLKALAVDLREDLLQMHRLVSEVKERSFAELALLEGRERAAVLPVVTRVVHAVERRFPATRVVVADIDEGCVVDVVGGSSGLERVVLNLLTNACEGDGERAATRVEVSVTACEETMSLRVGDDGPGFAPEQLPPDGTLSGGALPGGAKPGGSGFGLKLSAGFVVGSGGVLRCGNRPEGGALVVVELPRVRVP